MLQLTFKRGGQQVRDEVVHLCREGIVSGSPPFVVFTVAGSFPRQLPLKPQLRRFAAEIAKANRWHIGFQDHRDELWYSSNKIKTLD